MWGCRGRSIQGTAKVWGSCEGWRIKQCHKMVLWQLCKNCGKGKWKVAAAGTGSDETDGCGIHESEDMDEKVGLIMKELGFSKQYRVMGRIGGLRKKGAEESDNADIGRNRLVSLTLESVAVKWRVVSVSRKLSSSENFKDIFISPDLTRERTEEGRKLGLKLKEIRWLVGT